MPRGVKTARSIKKSFAVKRELVVRQDGQHYGVVASLLGNNRLLVNLIDGPAFVVDVPCTIRGSMRRREWIHVGDVVLAACRSFGQEDTCDIAAKHVHDIVQRYTDDEVAQLKRFGELVIPQKQDELFQGSMAEDHEIVFEDVDEI